MDTRPLRIFLLGTTLAVATVVGLAPTSDASVNPPVQIPPVLVEPEPDWQIDPCVLVDCGPDYEIFDDCLVVPGICDPPGDDPADPGDPGDHETPDDGPREDPHEDPHDKPKPKPKPKLPRESSNPDVVQTRPAFTG